MVDEVSPNYFLFPVASLMESHLSATAQCFGLSDRVNLSDPGK